MERQLPTIMETDFSNIEIKAGGLNHLSILLEVKYKDSQKDGYPKIHEKFESYYSKLTSEYYPSSPGGERGVFFQLYKLYGYLPITTDSHLGEYIQWAYSVADHEAIMEFYNNYKPERCSNGESPAHDLTKMFVTNHRTTNLQQDLVILKIVVYKSKILKFPKVKNNSNNMNFFVFSTSLMELKRLANPIVFWSSALSWSNTSIYNSNFWPNGVIPSLRGRKGRKSKIKTCSKLSNISKSSSSAKVA